MMPISKSSYLNGLQCSKYLWVSFNQRELLPKPSAGAKFKFDQGHQIGNLAKELFPNGIEVSYYDNKKNAEDTAKLLSRRVPLFEAGFISDHTYARVDILNPVGKKQWDVIEVKSATSVKDVNISDVAFQRYCLEKAGLKVRKYIILHVNNSYVKKGKINPKKFFVKKDITKDVIAISDVEENIGKMIEVISATKCPNVPIGAYCSDPYDCPLMDQCWKHIPDHSVFELYRGGKKAFELFNSGIIMIKDIPENIKLSDKQLIQKNCETTGKTHIVKQEIQQFLNSIKYPAYYMDFETINPAIPLFDGMKPYQRIPFQFSLHIQESPDSELKHLSYITDGRHDPRKEFLDILKGGIGDKGSIIVHNQVFEKGVLKELAEAYPKYKKWVEHVSDRIIDQLVPFSNFYYYDRKQKGSASIKYILPALTGKSHKELEITNGEDASLTFMEITYTDVSPEYKIKKRKELERYCGLDTEAMVFIIEKLKKEISHS